MASGPRAGPAKPRRRRPVVASSEESEGCEATRNKPQRLDKRRRKFSFMRAWKKEKEKEQEEENIEKDEFEEDNEEDEDEYDEDEDVSEHEDLDYLEENENEVFCLTEVARGEWRWETAPMPPRLRISLERHALKNLSRSTPAMSPSASPRHSDSEGPPRVSKGTKKFMRHFSDAPPSERVLNYFNCALVSDILLQGTLYITPNFFAFYSKIFSRVSRLLIPVSQVASVQKERTAKIIPNAVGLHMVDGKSYVFGSLLSRDSTYKLMNHIWKKAQMMGDSDSEPPSAAQVAVEDDGDDSGSGSADSLMEEDQPDAFIRARALTTAAPTAAPWSREGSTTTNATSSTTSNGNTATTTSTLNDATPQNNVSLPQQRPVGGTKPCTLPEEPGGAACSQGGADGGIYDWLTQGSVVKTCFRVSSIPIQAVGRGVRELWALPRTSMLLLISTLLLALLFVSAAFMLHRVDVLSQQLGLENYDEYSGIYEEVLQMQQRLHAATSSEIEKTLSLQLKHIATVRQSLEALVVLFNKEPPMPAQIPDNT